MRNTLFAAVAAVTLFAAGAASAQMVHYSATLKGAEGVKGSGELQAMLDGKSFTYSASYKDLTGPVVAAHFHGPAAPGANAPPVLPVTVTPSPLKGSATLTDAQIADLNAGKWYLNIHTAANPGGEIRGTVTAAH
jgi:hypothetical protein